MNTTSLASQVLACLGYALLQVFFLQGVVLADFAFCWLYVSFLLFLPIQIDRLLLLVIAFGFGLFVDLFYDTLGVNASACLALAYSRKWVLNLLSPSGGYEVQQRPLLRDMRLRWFVPYTLSLLAIHHLTLFLVEAASFQNFGLLLVKVVMSMLFTFVTILLFQYLFYQKR